MDKKGTNVKKAEMAKAETCIVYELERGFIAGAVVYRLTCSIRGREGTLTRDWRVGHGGLSEGQYRDLSGYVLAAIAEAIVPVDGVATVLPL
jgi:hypothetical protein